MDVAQDMLERRINNYAERSFRDMADGDYITARLACRSGLLSQFQWSAQQAIEKYLKYILLVNRIPAKNVNHDIRAALELAKKLPFKIDLYKRSQRFIQHIAEYGEYRYLDRSYFVVGHALVELDVAIWDLRRYAQVLDASRRELPIEEQELIAKAWEALRESGNKPPQKFRLHGGFLERILDNKEHPARKALIWQNACFGSRVRRRVLATSYMDAQNAPLYLYPDMLDELNKYVHIPSKLREGYRQHLEAIKRDPSKRP